MPEGNRRAPRVFPQTIELKQLRYHGRRRKVVGIERYAARLDDELLCHCPEHLKPREPAVILTAAAAISPPQPRQIHFGRNSRRGVRLSGAEFDHPGQVEKVSRNTPRGMFVAEDDSKRPVSLGKNGRFVVGNRVHLQGRNVGAGHVWRKLVLPVVVAGGTSGDRTPARVSRNARKQVADSSPVAGFIDLIDVVDKQGCPAAAAEFVKEFILRYGAANCMGHRKPAAWNNPAIAEHDDFAFRLKAPGEVFHNRRLADAGRADNVQYAMRLQSRMALIDQFSAGKPYTADLIFDFVQRVVGCF